MDLNGDGAADLAVRVGGTLRVLLNRQDLMGKATGSFDALPELALPADAIGGPMAFGEFRGKRQPELMISMQPTAGKTKLYAVGLGPDRQTLAIAETLANTLVNATALSVADFNQDGLQDVVLIDKTASLMSVTSWRMPTPAQPVTRAYHVGHAPAALASGLLDADSYPDLAFAVQAGPSTPLVGLSVVYALPPAGLP